MEDISNKRLSGQILFNTLVLITLITLNSIVITSVIKDKCQCEKTEQVSNE